jgi:hypothetical protein
MARTCVIKISFAIRATSRDSKSRDFGKTIPLNDLFNWISPSSILDYFSLAKDAER